MTTTLDRLELAKHVLENGRKWCKGQFYDLDTGKRCLSGALGFTEMQLGIDVHMYSVVRNEIPDEFARITHFNDALGTRWSDISDVLDRAMEKERAACLSANFTQS